MSVCELLSPSTVKGDPPVRSSYIKTPRLHQSTAWKTRGCHQQSERKTTRFYSRNYLVVPRRSPFYNFWSHIFNSATHRKGPFHLFQTKKVMTINAWVLWRVSSGAETKLRSPDQTLYSFQNLSERYDRLNPGEYFPVLSPDRQSRAANRKINMNCVAGKGQTEIQVEMSLLITLCRCSSANTISPLYNATSCSLKRTLCTKCVKSSPPFT